MSLQRRLETYPTWLTPPAELRMLLAELYPIETDEALIRVGPMGDGGYLVPDDLEELGAVFSPGVSVESGFELDCARRGLPVFLADGSVEQPLLHHERFHFRRAFLGPYSAPGVITMEEWVAAASPEPHGDLLLQMDIEGDEYVVFLTTPASLLQRFRIMVVEFHYLHLLPTLQFFRLAAPVFRRLLSRPMPAFTSTPTATAVSLRRMSCACRG